MMYKIVFQKAALKFIKKQDKKTQGRLLDAINQLPMGTGLRQLLPLFK